MVRAGALMGVVGAGLALCFMHLHWGLKKLWLKMGLHVSLSLWCMYHALLIVFTWNFKGAF